MSKTLSKYITALYYTGKTLLVLSVANCGVSLCPFTTIAGTPIEIASASISLVFLAGNLKSMERKRSKHRKTVLLGRSKLNSSRR